MEATVVKPTIDEVEKHDVFRKFIHHLYFPFIKSYKSYILVGWLAIFIISVIYGPPFLDNTKSDLDIPAGSPASNAFNAFKANYPTATTWPPSKLSMMKYILLDV